MTQDKIPVIYAFIYMRLKEKLKGDNVMKRKDIRARIAKTIGWSVDYRKGIPKSMFYAIMEDMVSMRLIKKLNNYRYRILTSNCDKKIRQFIW